jgi:hypothetical protein
MSQIGQIHLIQHAQSNWTEALSTAIHGNGTPLSAGGVGRIMGLRTNVSVALKGQRYCVRPLTAALLISKDCASLSNSCWVGRCLPLTTKTCKQVSRGSAPRRHERTVANALRSTADILGDLGNGNPWRVWQQDQ